MNILDPKNNLEFRDYLTILKRRKWFFITPFVIAVAIGSFKIFSNVPFYTSKCTIQIKPSTLKLLPTSIKETLPRVSEPATAFAMKKQILSTEYLQQVLDKLGLVNHPKVIALAEEKKEAFPDKHITEIYEIMAMRTLRSSLSIINRTPTIILLTATSEEPELAYDIVKTLSDIYIADSYRRSMSMVQSAISFNDEQIAIFKKRVETAERELEAFKRSQITSRLLDESLSSEELVRIHRAVVSVDITAKEKQDYIDYLQKQLPNQSDLNNVPKAAAIRDKLNKIDIRIDEMASLMKSFSWRSPEVINVNRKINDIREEIRIELETIIKQKMVGGDLAKRSLTLEKLLSYVDLEILDKKRRAFNALIASFKDTRSKRPANEMKLSKLMAELNLNRRIYNTFLRQNEGVQIEEMISQTDASDRFKVLEVPRIPLKPSNAGSNMIMLVTAIAALGLGTGAVYSREFLDNSFRTVNEVEEYIKLPVLGVLPNMDAFHQQKSEKKRPVLVIVLVIVLAIVAAFFVYYEFFSPGF